MPKRRRARNASGPAAPEEPAASPSPAATEQPSAPTPQPKYARTIYLYDEDLDRLLHEKRRLERGLAAGGRRQGVTDLSAIIRRLIREALPLPPGWVPRR